MPALMNFVEFLINGLFIVIIAAMICGYVQKLLCHPETERGFKLRGMSVFINYRHFVPASELIFSANRTWGMVGFSFIALIQSIGAIISAFKAVNLKEDSHWEYIYLKNILLITIK